MFVYFPRRIVFKYKVTQDAASLPGLTTRFHLRCNAEFPRMVKRYLEDQQIQSELLPGSAEWTAELDVSPDDFERVNRLVWTLKTARKLPVAGVAGIKGGWAMSRYKQGPPKDGGSDWANTEIGDLISRAKYPDDPDHPERMEAAREIALRLAEFVRFDPAYSGITTVLSAYSSDPLARLLGETVAEFLGVAHSVAALKAGRKVVKAKNLARGDAGKRLSPQDLVLEEPPPGATHVLLVDDVWTTGQTLQAHAAACQQQWNAGEMMAVVAARTHRRS